MIIMVIIVFAFYNIQQQKIANKESSIIEVDVEDIKEHFK
jgi:hypothetical protein